jgi:hypothetical protein
MPTITKNKIIYDEKDWLAGLHPQYGSKTIPQKFGRYSRQEYNFNPFDDLGYAKNGFLGVNFLNNNRVTSVVSKVIEGSDYFYYGIDAKNKFYRFSNIGASYGDVDSTGIFPYDLGTKSLTSDIIQHFAGNSKINAIFVTYNTDTIGTGLAYSIDDETSIDADYLTTKPNGAFTFGNAYPHPLCVGYDDTLYIGDGNRLHCYDYANTASADGKIFQDVLILPDNYVIKSIIKLQPRSLVILAQKGIYGVGEVAKAFFWDYLSSDPYQIKEINNRMIITAFEYRGTIGCLSFSGQNKMNVKIFNGSEFEILFKLRNLELYSTGEPLIGSVDVNENEIYVHLTDQTKGYICKYGNNLGVSSKLNIVGRSIAGILGCKAGFVKYIPQYNNLCFSTGKDDGTSATIQWQDTSKYATDGYWYSDLTDIGDERIRITGITVYFADEFTGGRTISLSLTDRYTSYAIKGLTNLATVTLTNRIYRVKPFNNTGDTLIPPLDGVGIKLDWGAGAGSSVTPIINKIILDYEPVKIN